MISGDRSILASQDDWADNWEEMARAHADLSPVDLQFRETALRDPELLRPPSHTGGGWQFAWPCQAWPLFISPARLGELAGAAIAVSQLIRSIPERIFHNDAERMAAVFGLDKTFVQLMLRHPDGIAEALARGDFILGPSGFKCLELNIAGNLGGLDTSLIADMILGTPAIRRFVDELGRQGRRVTHQDSLRPLARYIADRALAAGLSDGVVNTLLAVRNPDAKRAELNPFYQQEYRAALAALSPPLEGELFISGYEGVTIEGGILYRNGVRLHALIEGDMGKSEMAALRCFKLRTLHLYNGPITFLLAAKSVLAVLSEQAESDAFSAEERAAIERHVPWTRRLVPGPVLRHGERADLERLVLARREEMVLKKARSSSGKDVVPGAALSPQEWEQMVAQALSGGDWVVQELVAHSPYLFQNGETACPHNVIWGPFLYGKEYAGTLMRVMPTTGGTVVNSTRGAKSTILLEVEDPPA